MNIIRIAARPMLASYFIFSGVKSIANPGPLVADAKPLVDKAVPLVKSAAPQIAPFVPNDTTNLIRLNGVASVLGGLGLATGMFRRPSALLLALTTLPHVVAVNPMKGADADERSANRSHFVRNVALLGGALIASQDLEGRPSLGWRAAQKQREIARATDKTVGKMSRKARKQAKQLEKAAQKQAKVAQKQAKKAGHQLAEVLPG